MKTIKKILIFLITVGAFGCCKKDDPTPEIKLSESSIELEIGQEKTISLSGGNGTYTISPATSDVADAVISGATLKVTAKKEGTQTFTITSADKTAGLMVKVKPFPELGKQLGAYQNGKLLFSYAMSTRKKDGIWLCEKSQNPYGKRLFLSYIEGSPEVRQEIIINILAEGVPSIENTGNQPRPLKARVEKINNKIIQLQSGDLRFITELKE